MKHIASSIFGLLLIMSCTTTPTITKQDHSADSILTPEAMHELGYISNPQVSPDGQTILYAISYTSIKENKTLTNLWISNTDGSGKQQLSNFGKSVSGASWSKDGSSIFFLQDGQLYKAAYKAGKLGRKQCLSKIGNGISDYRISPDESSIYYVSSIPGTVSAPKDRYQDLPEAKAYTTDKLMYRHWDHWVTDTPRTFVASLNNGIITEDNSFDILGDANKSIELPTEPFGGAEQLCWSPDSRRIAYSCRLKTGIEYAFSTNCDIFIYDILTGCATPVTNGGGYDTDPVWSPDGSKLAWISMERDGYEADKQRLFVADVAFGEAEEGQCGQAQVSNIREVAGGLDADVSGIFWTPCSSKIIFPATVDGIQALFNVKVDKAAEPARLTPENWWFNFGTPYFLDHDGEDVILYTSYQSNLFPTELVKVIVGKGGNREPEYVQISNENTDYFAHIGQVRQEKLILKSNDGGDLQCWVLFPPEFDSNKVYPAIEMFNGGPQSSLDQSWSKRWNFGLMAQQGYVVILPNRHGCSGFGQAWKEQISGDYQGLNMQDYRIAGQWIKDQKWCGKLAGVGASYGGFSVYNMMGLNQDDLFDCFISHAGIFDEKALWYTTEEMWFANWDNGGLTQYSYESGQTGPKGDGITFGGMQQAGAPYAVTPKAKEHYSNDPEAKLTKWHTPILCIHGMLDFRIPYTQGMAAFNAAQMMGVPSKLIIFPEECHWVQKPQNCIYWQREFFDWLEKYIKD